MERGTVSHQDHIICGESRPTQSHRGNNNTRTTHTQQQHTESNVHQAPLPFYASISIATISFSRAPRSTSSRLARPPKPTHPHPSFISPTCPSILSSTFHFAQSIACPPPVIPEWRVEVALLPSLHRAKARGHAHTLQGALPRKLLDLAGGKVHAVRVRRTAPRKRTTDGLLVVGTLGLWHLFRHVEKRRTKGTELHKHTNTAGGGG